MAAELLREGAAADYLRTLLIRAASATPVDEVAGD
jgi:hypothetical protein